MDFSIRDSLIDKDIVNSIIPRRQGNYDRSKEEASRDVPYDVRLRKFGLSTMEIDVYRVDDHANYGSSYRG